MCRSLTYAQRAARVLERSGITAVITRAPQGTTDVGCAYCVKVWENRLKDALSALRQSGLGPNRVLMPLPGGKYRETEP
jgi:hypothetical protein